MSEERVKYTVISWPNGRWRAQVLVDDYPVEKKYYETLQEAERWAQARVAELLTVVR